MAFSICEKNCSGSTSNYDSSPSNQVDSSDVNIESNFSSDGVLSVSKEQKSMDPAPQMKTITLEQYKVLMQLIPKVRKYEDDIRRLDNLIESKDAQMEELRNCYQRGKKWIDISQLTTVNMLHTSS